MGFVAPALDHLLQFSPILYSIVTTSSLFEYTNILILSLTMSSESSTSQRPPETQCTLLPKQFTQIFKNNTQEGILIWCQTHLGSKSNRLYWRKFSTQNTQVLAKKRVLNLFGGYWRKSFSLVTSSQFCFNDEDT